MQRLKTFLQRIRVRALYFCAGVAIGALAAIYSPDASAHPGGLSKTDGCHNLKQDGQVVERHWHAEGTWVVGGACKTIEGVNVRVWGGGEAAAEEEKANTAMATKLAAAERELGSTLTQLAGSDARAQSLSKKLNTTMGKLAIAERARHESLDRVDELTRQLAAERGGLLPCVAERERLAGRVQERWARNWRADARRLIRCLGGAS